MTDDLVKRLREYRIGCGIHCSAYDAREPLDECIEAADRIEQLEAALFESMALNINYHSVEEDDGYQFTEAPAVIEMARKALEGKDEQEA